MLMALNSKSEILPLEAKAAQNLALVWDKSKMVTPKQSLPSSSPGSVTNPAVMLTLTIFPLVQQVL